MSSETSENSRETVVLAEVQRPQSRTVLYQAGVPSASYQMTSTWSGHVFRGRTSASCFAVETHLTSAEYSFSESFACEVMAGGLRVKRITGDPALRLAQGQPGKIWLLVSAGICMRRCSLQEADLFRFVVYLRECTDGCALEGRFLPSFLSLPFSNALGYYCILEAWTAVLGKV